jgi:hypothetical protein
MLEIYTGAQLGCHRLSGAVILRARSRYGKALGFMAAINDGAGTVDRFGHKASIWQGSGRLVESAWRVSSREITGG